MLLTCSKLLFIIVTIALIISGTIFSGCVQNKTPAKKTETEIAIDIVTDLKEKNYTDVYNNIAINC